MDLFCHVYFLLENDILQGLTYEEFDRMPTPLHMPKTETCKKSTPCLTQKASRGAADHTSKTTVFFIFHHCS